MLLCELPSKNDLDITDHDFWADNDIYDCSDFKFPDEEGPKDNHTFLLKISKKVKKELYKSKHAANKKFKIFEKIDQLIS